MNSKVKTGRIGEILGVLSKAKAGDYSAKIEPAANDDELALVENAVNDLLSELHQKHAFHAAGETEENRHHRNMLAAFRESYFEADLKGHFSFFTDRVTMGLGYSPEELRNMHIDQLMDEINIKKTRDIFERIFFTGQPVQGFECEIFKKDGSKMDIECAISLLRDDSGKPAGLRGVVRDISERKQAQRELKRSEEKYRNILADMEEAYVEFDFHGRYVFFNTAFCRMLGYSREELQDSGYRMITPPYAIKRVVANVLEVYKSGKKGIFTNPVLCKDGSIKYAELSIALLRSESGEPVRFSAIGRDITERMKSEQKLKESERHLRLITDNIRDIIWTMNFDLQWTYVSPSVRPLTGFTPEEIIQMSLKEVVHPSTYSAMERALLEAQAGGTVRDSKRPVTFELEMKRKDGSRFWAEIRSSFNRDEEGKPFEILGVTRDITERKQAEEALRESERRYRMIVENMNDIIWTIGLDLQFRYVSPSCTRLTGYTPGESCRTPLEQLLTPASYSYALSRLADELALEKSGKEFDPNRAITLEIEAIRKDGISLWLEITGTFNRDHMGEISEILIIGRNITARKEAEKALEESEKRYRIIVENIQEVIWTTDLDLKSTYISPICLQFTGYRPDEAGRIPLSKILTTDSFELMRKVIGEELKKESRGDQANMQRSRTFELEVIHKNGGLVRLEVTATFTRDHEGHPSGVLMAGRDITARRKAQDEKDKLERQLTQAQKMETIGRLAGGVAHDFNNMLSVIMGYVDLAKRRLAKQHPVLSDIAEIEKAAIRSRDLTTQLLAFSRKQIIAPRVINLNDLVAHTQRALIRLIGEDIQLCYHPGDNLWDIKFDPSQLEQILINLAVNARDAMPDGGKLTIETGNAVLDASYCANHAGFIPGSYVRLSVSDNGVGIDRAVLPYVFEPFFTTKEAGKGTGLGLATVYGIVKQNNGFINVYSETAHGTAFTIYMPRTSEGMDDRSEPEEESLLTGTANILLVEDDAMVLQIAREMLESLGYNVTAADNPLEAIEICRNPDHAIDLVITDVVMPAMKGKELKNRLIEIRPDLKVLFMSGYTANVIAHHGVLEKGVQFLQKPFTIADLAKKVGETIKEPVQV